VWHCFDVTLLKVDVDISLIVSLSISRVVQAAAGEWPLQDVHCLPSSLLKALLLQGNSELQQLVVL